MPAKSIYIRIALVKPLKKYCKDRKVTEGVALNIMAEIALKRNGYLKP